MNDNRCNDCEWAQTDIKSRRRCYSPQVRKSGLSGMMINFERDDFSEPDRSHAAGTGKCGPSALNFRKRTSL